MGQKKSRVMDPLNHLNYFYRIEVMSENTSLYIGFKDTSYEFMELITGSRGILYLQVKNTLNIIISEKTKADSKHIKHIKLEKLK